jgi:hypothetical protein
MSIATRGTIVYTPTVEDWVGIYLELFEVAFCFMVAILREMFTLTAQAVRYIEQWQEWRWFGRLGPVEVGFDLQQDWDDLEVVWFSWDWDSYGFSVYWCRQSGWVKVSW